MGAALPITAHHDPDELRALARQEKGRVASRMIAIANALEGMTRATAARLAGMDRQTLRDWVIRYNAKGIAGLADLPKGHNPEKLTEDEKKILLERILQTPDPQQDGVSSWTVADLCAFAKAEFDKAISASGMWGILKRMGLSHQKTRPVHPKTEPAR